LKKNFTHREITASTHPLNGRPQISKIKSKIPTTKKAMIQMPSQKNGGNVKDETEMGQPMV
jgi:hypothetical protein